MSLSLTVVILTKDERVHIRRCLERLQPLEAERVVVVDSLSTDGTQRIARELGAEVVEHPWPGNQAEQFNWAIDNFGVTTQWILRLDADEYLTPELIEEIREKLPGITDDIYGVSFKRRHIFMGRWMKRGIYPVKLLRLFRTGHGRYEQRLMDEHIRLDQGGGAMEFDNDFCDHNLNNLSWFCHKHVDYAVREAAEMLDAEFGLTDHTAASGGDLTGQALRKRKGKQTYARLPLFWRAAAYFLYRYILRGAFLEGREGFIFTFLQGWWYRTLVDAKVYEIKRKSNGVPEAMKRILKEEYNIRF